MPSTLRRTLVAALVALLVLLIAHWFDAAVLVDAENRAGHSYDYGPLTDLIGIAHIVTAAGVLVIGLAGWRSRSLVVGIGYAIVGSFIVFLPALYWAFAVSDMGAPTVAPQPIASTLSSWDLTLATGVTGAVFTLGAAMLLSGIVVIASVLRAGRRRATDEALMAEQASRSEPAQL